MGNFFVCIVGAGPTGLMLALTLAKYNVPFRIIDQKSGPSTHSKAFGYWPRTLEMLRPFGLADLVKNEGNPIYAFTWYAYGNEIGRLPFDLIKSLYPFLTILPQSSMEEILINSLKKQGIEVEWNTPLKKILSNGETVELLTGDENASFPYVVGCDGSKSLVRKELNISFEKEPYHQAFVLCDALFEAPFKTNEIVVYLCPEGPFVVFPMKEGISRIIYMRDSKEHTVTPKQEDVEKMAKERSGIDIKIKQLFWLSPFGFYHSIAENFRKGNIFLAGDAAHVHSPFGGQGSNTGMQDGYNLGWKLSLLYQKQVHKKLLDSYETERKEIAYQVVDLSDKLTRGTNVLRKILKLPKAIVGGALKMIVGNLLKSKKLQEKITNRLGQISLSYQPSGNLVLNVSSITTPSGDKKALIDLIGQKNYTLLAVTPPDVTLEDITALDQHVRSLINNYVSSPIDPMILETGQKKYFEGSFHSENYPIKNKALLLIRPDRYIAFTKEGYPFEALDRKLDTILIRKIPLKK